MTPYTDIEKTNDHLVREFNSTTDKEELVWHRDREDRKVTVLQDTDWQFQFDNELPIPLYKGLELFIPKGVYHRVLKGTTTLTVLIEKR